MRVARRIYLVPGFFGFSNLGRLRYFLHARNYLLERSRALGSNTSVHVVRTHPTASLPRRAARLLDTMAATHAGGTAIHLIGHSSGGLDTRLLASPGVRLAGRHEVERFARTVRSVVTVATPHRGAPMASLLTGLLGQRLLRVLSLSTIYGLHFGRLPLSALLQIGTIFARLDNLGVNSALLDQLFDALLDDFSPGRRRAVRGLFAEVARDQGLLLQLTPEGTDLFNATVADRPTVRYGCVTAEASRPGFRTTWRTGLDPTAQATHAVYGALYRLSARSAAGYPAPDAAQARALRRAYGRLPGASANDGIVPTRSQLWGEVVHAARADHLDVLGHFDDRSRVPPHFDWLSSGSGFDRRKFEALWNDVFDFLIRAEGEGPTTTRETSSRRARRAALGKRHRAG